MKIVFIIIGCTILFACAFGIAIVIKEFVEKVIRSIYDNED